MNTVLPDKYVRKAIYDQINNMVVNTFTFPCFTERTGTNNPDTYVLLSTQLNLEESTKCGNGWINDTEIQVIVRVMPNQGAKDLIDDAVNEVLTLVDGMTLGGGLVLNSIRKDVVFDFADKLGNKVVYRKIIKVQTYIS